MLKDLSAESRALREMIPDVCRGFAEMSRAAHSDRALALEPEIKELMAMAIAVVHGCGGYIAARATRYGPGLERERRDGIRVHFVPQRTFGGSTGNVNTSERENL